MYCSASPQPLSIYDFVQEGDSGIWLTNPDAELMYGDAGSGTVETVYLTDDRGNEVSPHVETLFHDGQGRLWLVTHDGAYVVDAASRRILAHYYLEDAPYSENNLCSYCVTSGSEIWFGTRGGGVNLLSRDGSMRISGPDRRRAVGENGFRHFGRYGFEKRLVQHQQRTLLLRLCEPDDPQVPDRQSEPLRGLLRAGLL
ncbi:MAG: hypothetical protein ACLSH3_07870 [Alistipes finegoldii]